MKSIANTLDLLNHAIGFLTKHTVVSERADKVFEQPIKLVEKFTQLREKLPKKQKRHAQCCPR
jgi:hypothetical protein